MMKRRHPGHMNNGSANNPRRGPQQGKYGFQKPRKNYAVLRDKYINMAREAMSAGDRVLAEYYLQHADHYSRMQQEFLAERAARYQHMKPDSAEEMQDEGGEEEANADVGMPNNSNVLPAFLTRQVPPTQEPRNDDKAMAPMGWEEE